MFKMYQHTNDINFTLGMTHGNAQSVRRMSHLQLVVPHVEDKFYYYSQ